MSHPAKSCVLCSGHSLESEVCPDCSPNGTWTWVWNDVILLGGGSAAIGGRSRISAALRSGPAYRSVARYKLHRESDCLLIIGSFRIIVQVLASPILQYLLNKFARLMVQPAYWFHFLSSKPRNLYPGRTVGISDTKYEEVHCVEY